METKPTRAPRETASTRRARVESERLEKASAEWAEFSATYHTRFVNALYCAMADTYTFNVTRNDDNFVFSITVYDDYLDATLPLNLPAEFTWEVVNALDSIERKFAEIDEKVAELQRRAARKYAALAKLDAEERQLLGL